MTAHNRWLLAAADVPMQVAFGAVYVWSVFRTPLSHAYNSAAFEMLLLYWNAPV